MQGNKTVVGAMQEGIEITVYTVFTFDVDNS